jgi:nitroimidazol reductase NimA-like FMN-containing flavoprotein (pyridoxamine 5'-phosphate oxidase superfamily)
MDTTPDSKFEKTSLNTVGRRRERGFYDKRQIADIFREAKICHVSFIHDFLPQCIPMVSALEETPDGDLILYLHGNF